MPDRAGPTRERLANAPKRSRALAVGAAALGVFAGLACAASAPKAPTRSGTIELTRPRDLAAQGRFAPGRQRALIQIDGPLTDERRAQLHNVGVRLLQYTGEGTFVARFDPGVDATALQGISFVEGVGEYQDRWKTPAGFGGRVFQSPARRALAARGRALLQVHMFRDASDQEIEAAAAQVRSRPGGTVFRASHVGGNVVLSVEMRMADVPALEALDAVEFIEDAPEISDRNTTARGVVQSGMAGMTPLYANGLTGLGEVVGVCDSGLDPDHCSFTNPPGKLLAYNGTETITTHGTHVCGIAVGNGGGEATGHAYDANLVFSLQPAFTFTDLTSILELQASETARVHTNSWGDDSTTEYTGLCRAIDAFMHSDEDQLVVFAATNLSTLRTPENAKNCLSVGASDDSPDVDDFCKGGNGLTSDQRLKPDIFAPGCNISSSSANTSCNTLALTGTSMAAPAIAGVATLMREYFVDGFYPTGTPTPGDGFTPSGALLKACVLNSATGMGGVPNLPANQSSFIGWGRVVADDALYFPSDTRTLYVDDVRNASGLETGSVVERAFNVMGSDELRVTLVWTDAPPAPGASIASVNNLDLELIAPDATTTYLGNNFTGGTSVSGGVADARNNVEQIHIASPAPGLWTARILGTNIPEGPQGYALVVTGDVVGPPRPLSVTIVDRPSVLAVDDFDTQFDVRVDENDDLLVPGTTPMLHYRYAGASFSSIVLTPLGGSMYRATLPGASCGHTPEFYVSAEGMQSGEVTAPPGGPSAHADVIVGAVDQSVLFSESFDSGSLPPGWAASGLWHVTGGCGVAPACGGPSWAYFGSDAICGYGTGFREQGTLASPVVALPSIGPGEKLTLRYCSTMDKEEVTIYDRGFVRANGALLEEAPDTDGAWETREVDLSGFAGQNVSLSWFFDSLDGFENDFHGWQIDDVEIVLTQLVCEDPCPGDDNGDGHVDVFDFAKLASWFGLSPNATRGDGDLDGSGTVDVFDFAIMSSHFGETCGNAE